jgi:hypothetical protein
MLRCIINLYDRCHKAVTESDSKVTWNTIKATMGPIIHQVTILSFTVSARVVARPRPPLHKHTRPPPAACRHLWRWWC